MSKPTGKIRTCVTCRQAKPNSAFASDGRGGIRAHCTQCYNAGRMLGTPRGRPPKVIAQPESLPPIIEHRLKQRVADLEARNRDLISQLASANEIADLAKHVANTNVKPITKRERKSGLREATALVLASDWHVEEIVVPEQVAGRNRYNLEIARRRMQRFFERVRWAIELNRQAFLVRDLVLAFLGDLISGYIHEELMESNLLSPVQAIAFVQSDITDGIRQLLKDTKIERVVIPCVDGNHGRLTHKTRVQTRTANSIEWLLYTNLALAFENDPRVQFSIAQAEHLYFDVYDRTIDFTHGDAVRYGGGIGGVTIPIYKAMGRWATVRRVDLTCMGHWHQYTSLADLIINGSLIGYGAYSMSIGARFEAPAQAFCMLDPVRFKSVSVPLWVSEAEDDQEQRRRRSA